MTLDARRSRTEHGLRGDKLMTDYFIGLASRLDFAAIEMLGAPAALTEECKR